MKELRMADMSAAVKKIALVNLGCSKNIVDGEKLADFLRVNGFTIEEDCALADVIVVNTCTFIQEATNEAIETIADVARYKKEGVCTTLIVAGCFSQRYRMTAACEFPEVDLWVGVDRWHEELTDFFRLQNPCEGRRRLTEPVATQYLKIAEGCSHGCSFCVIPSIRGKYRSRPVAEILDEARWLSGQGVKECIVVSQDTSFYGRDIKTSLEALLERLLAETDFHWIRMMYLHPSHISDALLRLVATQPRLCSYFDVPLQHIADPILSAMGRRITSQQTRAVVERIRTIVPDATVRTSFIVGFPGETAREFGQLMEFVEWARFEKMGVFPYSPEEGTIAATMRGRPRTTTAQGRAELLMELQTTISRSRCESYIGRNVEVIVDDINDNPDCLYLGRTQGDAPEIDGRVHIVAGTAQPGSFYRASVVDCDDYDLFATIGEPGNSRE